MRAAIRPLVTTGVALVGAAVIVANPVSLPPADVAIRAEQSPAEVRRDLHLVDPAFLEALAAAGPQPTDPVEYLPRLVAALTDDAAPVSREAIAAAHAAGVAVASGPTPTGASVPNLPAAVGPSNPWGDPTQVFQQTLEDLVEDVNYVGAEVVAAAFAAGAVEAAMPTLIADPLTSARDLAAALSTAVSTVIGPLGPPARIIDAIRTVIENQVAEVASAAPPGAAPEADAEVHGNPSHSPSSAPTNPHRARLGRMKRPLGQQKPTMASSRRRRDIRDDSGRRRQRHHRGRQDFQPRNRHDRRQQGRAHDEGTEFMGKGCPRRYRGSGQHLDRAVRRRAPEARRTTWTGSRHGQRPRQCWHR